MNRLVFFILTISIVFCLQSSLSAQTDAISKYFNKYVEDDRFTVVYVSSKMIDMFKKMDLNLEDKEAQAVMNVTKDMRGLRILIAEENTLSLYEEALKTINTKEYEVLMTIRDKKEDNVQLLVKTTTDENFVEEILLLVGSIDSFVLMSIVGKIDLKKVSELSDAFEEEDDKN